MMKYGIFFIGLLSLLSACSDAQDSANNASGTASNETKASWNKMKEMFGAGPAQPKPVRPAQPRYCYKTYEDVICYNQPIAGEEYRLTGFQEASGKTGYILTPPHHAAAEVNDEGYNNHIDMAPLPAPHVHTSVTVSGSGASGSSSGVATGIGGTPLQPPKKLKEVIFDPADLQPKELVPPAAQ